MNRSYTAKRLLPTLLALGFLLVPVCSTTAAGTDGERGIVPIAQNGFGEHENAYAWSMGWFQGKLYVGTGRDVLCVEDPDHPVLRPRLELLRTHPASERALPRKPLRDGSAGRDLAVHTQVPRRGRWCTGPRPPSATPMNRAGGSQATSAIAAWSTTPTPRAGRPSMQPA